MLVGQIGPKGQALGMRIRIVLMIAMVTQVVATNPARAQSSAPAAADTATVLETPPPPPIERSVREHALRRHSGDLSPANEQGDTQRPPPPGLAGDWFGLKPLLADAGIGLTSRYVSEWAWNYTGGKRRDVTEAGQLDIGLLLDMQKLAGINGTFQATITYRNGHQLDQRAGLGTLQQVQEIYGRGQTWRLTQFWYEQTILGGGIDMKVGRTSPGEDFAAFSCSFQNLSFCGSQPGNLVGNYWFNWPVSQWGGRFRANRGRAYVQIAFYEENPLNLDNSFTLGHFHGATGALIPLEVGVVRGGENGSPVGSYKIGGWLSTANSTDVFLDLNRRPLVLTDLPPLERSSSHGFWVNIQQQLTGHSVSGKSMSGLTIFLNATAADRKTSTIDNQIAIGLFEKGLFPWFTEDVIGLGFVRTHVNSRVARSERLDGEPVQGSEYAAELYYGFHPRSWLELRPNLQWVHHAGGYHDAKEVGVAGLKAALTL
jgi:porin